MYCDDVLALCICRSLSYTSFYRIYNSISDTMPTKHTTKWSLLVWFSIVFMVISPALAFLHTGILVISMVLTMFVLIAVVWTLKPDAIVPPASSRIAMIQQVKCMANKHPDNTSSEVWRDVCCEVARLKREIVDTKTVKSKYILDIILCHSVPLVFAEFLSLFIVSYAVYERWYMQGASLAVSFLILLSSYIAIRRTIWSKEFIKCIDSCCWKPE